MSNSLSSILYIPTPTLTPANEATQSSSLLKLPTSSRNTMSPTTSTPLLLIPDIPTTNPQINTSTTEPPVRSIKSEIAVGVMGGILCIVVLVVAIQLFCARKRKQKVSKSGLISPLNNPVHQGIHNNYPTHKINVGHSHSISHS